MPARPVPARAVHSPGPPRTDSDDRHRTMTASATPNPHDVRMRGFSRRAEVADVWRWVDRHARPLAPEAVALDDASGRVLAVDVVATLDVPAFDRAAMDGYALRADETTGAG